MQHVIIFYYIVSFAIGISSMIFFLLLWLKFKNRMLQYYFIFLMLFSSYLAINLCRAYLITIMQVSDIRILIVTFSVYFAWFPFFIYFMPLFFHHLVDRPYKPVKKAVFIAAGASYPVMYLITLLIQKDPEQFYRLLRVEMNTIGGILFYIELAYLTVFMVRSYFRIDNDLIRSIIKRFAVLTAVFLPFSLLDFNFQKLQLEMKIIPTGFFFSVLYYAVLNALSIFSAGRYFIAKMTVISGSDIPERFIRKYQLTEREKEIISLLLKGSTYKQISRTLFISQGTVKNHIYNVYQKTGVDSKTRLSELLQNTI